jgi:hypothetical protein
VPSSDQQAGTPDGRVGDPNQSESLCRQTMNDVPADFLPLSRAIDRLADGMWGGLQRPEPVAVIKQDQKKLSLGFGPWREEAAQRLRAAAIEGELVIYLLAKPQIRSEDHNFTECSPEKIDPLVVPVNVVKRLMVSRGGGLPDHPIRPSIKTADGNEKLFALLTVGLLVVRASDVDVWYQSERAKGRWPSQRSKLKINGRPTKQSEPLRNAVLAFVNDLKWNSKDRITTLHRLLVASGRSDVPSQDTVARLVDQLHRETGDMRLLRVTRVRRKQTQVTSALERITDS